MEPHPTAVHLYLAWGMLNMLPKGLLVSDVGVWCGNPPHHPSHVRICLHFEYVWSLPFVPFPHVLQVLPDLLLSSLGLVCFLHCGLPLMCWNFLQPLRSAVNSQLRPASVSAACTGDCIVSCLERAFLQCYTGLKNPSKALDKRHSECGQLGQVGAA